MSSLAATVHLKSNSIHQVQTDLHAHLYSGVLAITAH